MTMDRWEVGFRNIVTILVGPREEFSIPSIVELVRSLKAEQRRFLDTYRAVAVEGLGLTDPLSDESPDDAEQAGWDGLLSGKVSALRRERDALKAENEAMRTVAEATIGWCREGTVTTSQIVAKVRDYLRTTPQRSETQGASQ